MKIAVSVYQHYPLEVLRGVRRYRRLAVGRYLAVYIGVIHTRKKVCGIYTYDGNNFKQCSPSVITDCLTYESKSKIKPGT